MVAKKRKFIRNLSTHKLTDTEIMALGRGQKSVATPKFRSKSQLMKDTNEFIRRMRIKYIMRNSFHNHIQSQQRDYTCENGTHKALERAWNRCALNTLFRTKTIIAYRRIETNLSSQNNSTQKTPLDPYDPNIEILASLLEEKLE